MTRVLLNPLTIFFPEEVGDSECPYRPATTRVGGNVQNEIVPTFKQSDDRRHGEH